MVSFSVQTASRQTRLGSICARICDTFAFSHVANARSDPASAGLSLVTHFSPLKRVPEPRDRSCEMRSRNMSRQQHKSNAAREIHSPDLGKPSLQLREKQSLQEKQTFGSATPASSLKPGAGSLALFSLSIRRASFQKADMPSLIAPAAQRLFHVFEAISRPCSPNGRAAGPLYLILGTSCLK